MKNIKCLLGHRRMKLKDVETDTYENDNEKIKTYKCKHCGMIVGGRTLSVKAKVKSLEDTKEDEALNNKPYVRIREYENWSESNMRNRITIDSEDGLLGVIYFISEDEISEIEFMGMTLLTKQSFSIYEGLDIDCKIYKAKYLEDSDRIIPQNYMINGVSTFKASSYIGGYSNVKLNNESNILAIEYDCDKRYDKSGWWKFIHPRKFNIKYYCEE